jgi:hypothetical protein
MLFLFLIFCGPLLLNEFPERRSWECENESAGSEWETEDGTAKIVRPK